MYCNSLIVKSNCISYFSPTQGQLEECSLTLALTTLICLNRENLHFQREKNSREVSEGARACSVVQAGCTHGGIPSWCCGALRSGMISHLSSAHSQSFSLFLQPKDKGKAIQSMNWLKDECCQPLSFKCKGSLKGAQVYSLDYIHNTWASSSKNYEERYRKYFLFAVFLVSIQ